MNNIERIERRTYGEPHSFYACVFSGEMNADDLKSLADLRQVPLLDRVAANLPRAIVR